MLRRQLVRVFSAFVLLGGLLGTLIAAEPVPDYAVQVAPLFQKYCTSCHNPDEHEGKLSLRSFADLQKGGAHGPSILAGDAKTSRLIRVLTGEAKPQMPPEDQAQPTAAEVAILRNWVEGGARGPAGAEPDPRTLFVPQIPGRTERLPVTALAIAPRSGMIAVGGYGQVQLMTMDASEKLVLVRTLTGLMGKVTAVHFSADESQLLVASGIPSVGGHAVLFGVGDGVIVREFPAKNEPNRGHRDVVYDAELSPSGTLIATCSYDRRTILWDVANGLPVRTLTGHNGAIYDVAFSPDSTLLATASADDTCKIWRVSDGERLDTLNEPLSESYTVAFQTRGGNPETQVISTGADRRIRVWKLLSKAEPVINPQIEARFAHEGAVLQAVLTADGERLITAAADRTLKLWETRTFTQLKAYQPQPETTAAVAVSGDGTWFLVGRTDGSLQRYPLPPSGNTSGTAVASVGTETVTDCGDMTTAAVTANATPFTAAPVTEQEPNHSPSQAMTVTVPVVISGKIESARGQTAADYYRFTARAGEEWVCEINAARSGSLLDSHLEILTPAGERIPRVLLQAVKDSYFTFRGQDSNTTDDFRVFNWQEMELNDLLYTNGEVVKFWLYPRGPDSGFKLYPGVGQRQGMFDTTPLSHALGETCYIVRPHPPGTQLPSTGLPQFTLYYENDDDAGRQLGADSKLFFTAPTDGDYVMRVKDVRGFQGEKFTYTLTIRPPQPDFQVTLGGANPVVNVGSGKEFKVEVKRLDGFEGAIRVDISGLPPGFSVTTPLCIEAGQREAIGQILAVADAPEPTAENSKLTKVTATAMIRGIAVAHDVNNLGEIKRAEKSKLAVKITPANGGAVPLNAAPDAPLEFAIRPGSTIRLRVQAERADDKGLVEFGGADCGKNLGHGVYVDNIGLNGLMMLEDQSERDFFITASPVAAAQSRLFFLKTNQEGGQTTQPVRITVQR